MKTKRTITRLLSALLVLTLAAANGQSQGS